MKRSSFTLKEFFPASLLLTLPFVVASNCFAAEIDDIRAATTAANAAWTPAETSIYKLSPAERKKRNGYIQPQNLTAMAPGQQAPGEALYLMSAPSGSFDWRSFGGTNYVTKVRDQGSCGSCWAFAATAGIESYVLLHGNYDSSLNLSEQIVLSCSNAGTCNGGSPAGASNFLAGTGVAPESYYPYTASNGSCSSAGSGWQGAADTIVSWQYVTADKPDLATLKNAVYTYGPVVTTMSIYADFYAYRSGVYKHVTGALEGAHAVLIVGYADNTAYSGGGYFIAKNSWGTGWGEPGGTDTGGYFRIAYGELKSVTKFGWYSIAYDNKPTCSYSLDSSSATVTSPGGGSGVDLTAGSTCPWSAASSATWLTLGSASGTGPATISYNVAANTTSAARTGTITIKDAIARTVKTYTVTQQPLTYTLSAATSSLTNAGGAGSVGLTVSSSNATWSAVSSATTWLTITSGATGTGSGTISYKATPNTTSVARSAIITVKSASGTAVGKLTVSQDAASFSATATSGSYTSAGGTGSVNLTVDRSEATWTAVSSAPTWLTIKSGATGTGSGTVSYSVATNTTSLARKGTVTVKDSAAKVIYTLTVSQDAASFSATATSGTYTSAGGTGSVNLTVDRSEATWTAVSSAPTWLTIKSGATGTGSGTVSYSVAGNTTSLARKGTVTVKDSAAKVIYTLTVSEDAASFSATATSGAYTNAGGTGSINVTVDRSAATWTAVSSAATWLTIKSGATGTGSGTVSISVAANTGSAARTGTVTVKDSAAKVIFTQTVTEAASTFGFSATNGAFTKAGGTGSINVTVDRSDATWTATSNATWLVIKSGTTGTGTGTVSYSAAANTATATKTGTITIKDSAGKVILTKSITVSAI
jgi:C1A family cysteine protease